MQAFPATSALSETVRSMPLWFAHIPRRLQVSDCWVLFDHKLTPHHTELTRSSLPLSRRTTGMIFIRLTVHH